MMLVFAPFKILYGPIPSPSARIRVDPSHPPACSASCRLRTPSKHVHCLAYLLYQICQLRHVLPESLQKVLQGWPIVFEVIHAPLLVPDLVSLSSHIVPNFPFF